MVFLIVKQELKKEILELSLKECITKQDIYSIIYNHINYFGEPFFTALLEPFFKRIPKKSYMTDSFTKENEDLIWKIIDSLDSEKALLFLRDVVFYNPYLYSLYIFKDIGIFTLLREVVIIKRITFDELLSVFEMNQIDSHLYFYVIESDERFYKALKEKYVCHKNAVLSISYDEAIVNDLYLSKVKRILSKKETTRFQIVFKQAFYLKHSFSINLIKKKLIEGESLESVLSELKSRLLEVNHLILSNPDGNVYMDGNIVEPEEYMKSVKETLEKMSP